MDRIAEHTSGYMETEVDTDGIERRERPLFDIGAFREAWVNACVHNAWGTFTLPSVMVFDDRMEIVSYGRIPFPLSDDDFHTGNSRPPNPTMFRIFAKLNGIEQSGHGVSRIVKAYGRDAFHATDSGLKVTIPFAFMPRFVVMRRQNDEVRRTLNADKRAVLDYLEANPEAKLIEVSEKTGMTLSSVKKVVSALKSQRLLRNDGTNRNSIWAVTC